MKNKYEDFVKTTGYGTITGLCGINCRHHFMPFIEGMKNPYQDKSGNITDANGERIDSEKSKAVYLYNQKKRRMERTIRKTSMEYTAKVEQLKHITTASPDLVKYEVAECEKLKNRLRNQTKTYNDFLRDNEYKE
jgi:hypothetical protein